jgi:hypothetical protein
MLSFVVVTDVSVATARRWRAGRRRSARRRAPGRRPRTWPRPGRLRRGTPSQEAPSRSRASRAPTRARNVSTRPSMPEAWPPSRASTRDTAASLSPGRGPAGASSVAHRVAWHSAHHAKNESSTRQYVRSPLLASGISSGDSLGRPRRLAMRHREGQLGAGTDPLCGARIPRVGLTCCSRLGARAHPSCLLVHGPGIRLAGALGAKWCHQGCGDLVHLRNVLVEYAGTITGTGCIRGCDRNLRCASTATSISPPGSSAGRSSAA